MSFERQSREGRFFSFLCRSNVEVGLGSTLVDLKCIFSSISCLCVIVTLSLNPPSIVLLILNQFLTLVDIARLFLFCP